LWIQRDRGMEHGVIKNKESLPLEDHKRNSINKRKRKPKG